GRPHAAPATMHQGRRLAFLYPLPPRPAPATMHPMPDVTLLLVVADALVHRLRTRVERWAFDDMAFDDMTGQPLAPRGGPCGQAVGRASARRDGQGRLVAQLAPAPLLVGGQQAAEAVLVLPLVVAELLAAQARAAGHLRPDDARLLLAPLQVQLRGEP